MFDLKRDQVSFSSITIFLIGFGGILKVISSLTFIYSYSPQLSTLILMIHAKHGPSYQTVVAINIEAEFSHPFV